MKNNQGGNLDAFNKKSIEKAAQKNIKAGGGIVIPIQPRSEEDAKNNG